MVAPFRRGAGNVWLIVVRYGVGAVLVLAGIVLIVINPGGFGVDGFAMCVGAGLSVILLNLLFRLGVSGEREREREEEARRYFGEHGVWPDEDARPRGRTWQLAPGVETGKQEEPPRRGGCVREDRRSSRSI